MDHLLLPKDAISPRPRVPYICSNPYDELDFLDYPNRAGGIWLQVLPAVDSPRFWLREVHEPIDDKQLESFLQSWIFFGLLHELLSPCDLYEAEDYLESDAQGQFVHTRDLANTLNKWCNYARTLDRLAQETIKLRLTTCMRLAYEALLCLRADSSDKARGHPGFNRQVRNSILSVCETISNAAEMTLDVLPDVDWLYFSAFATFNEDEKAIMRQNGWCPSLIASEEKRYTTIALYVYLQHFRQPLEMDHSKCSDEQCTIIQIDAGTYSPRHVEDLCPCKAIGPQLSAVASCLDDGTFPVLDVCGDTANDLALNILPYREGVAYVALSHVWVDGLGNPADITLPACQILRLKTQVGSIKGQKFTWLEDREERTRAELRDLHLWCDSLLCPIQIQPDRGMTEEQLEAFDANLDVQRSKQLKSVALSHMREVYAEAAYVLVLDRAVEQVYALDMNSVEAAIHLLTSRWMQRLWTYQEAALPTKLLIKFADIVLDFRDLMLRLRLIVLENPVLRSIALVVFKRCKDLRSYQSFRAQGGPDLQKLNVAIRHRGVTYPSDEPLCAGTILRVDLGKIAEKSTCEDRMATLWSLYATTARGLPDNIIFNKFPRLSKAGFRWAPLTIRQGTSEEMRSFADPGSARQARLTYLGLNVQYRGWRIRLTTPAWGAVGSDWRRLHGVSYLLHVQAQDGKWFSMTKSDSPAMHPTAEQPLWSLLGQHPGADWHVIIDSDEIFGTREGREGILGILQTHESGVPIFSSRVLVAVTRLEPRHVTVISAAVEHAEDLQRDTAFFLYQLCFALNRLVALFTLLFPARLHKLLFLLLHLPVFWLSRLPSFLFARRLADRGKLSSQTNVVAEAMTKINATNIADYIAVCFTGSIAMVTESYPPEHEWCVE